MTGSIVFAGLSLNRFASLELNFYWRLISIMFVGSRPVSADSILIDMFFHMPVIALVFMLRTFWIYIYLFFCLLSSSRHHSSALYNMVEWTAATWILLVRFKNSPKRPIISLILTNTFLAFSILRLKCARISSLRSSITPSYLMALKRNLIFSPPISISTSLISLVSVFFYFFYKKYSFNLFYIETNYILYTLLNDYLTNIF